MNLLESTKSFGYRKGVGKKPYAEKLSWHEDRLVRCDGCHLKHNFFKLRKFAEKWICKYCLQDLMTNLPK